MARLTTVIVKIAAITAVALMVCGCASHMAPQGRTGVLAVYSGGGSLRATLPADVSVETVVAAGETSLRGRGYVIVRDVATQGAGVVTARQPLHGFAAKLRGRKIIVRSEKAPDGTLVTIDMAHDRDEAESRAVLDDMLALLGL